MTAAREEHGPLHGIRVIDTTAIISGPLATQILGDQGADVIKVEPPGIGDLTRPMGTQRNGLSAIYAAVNRNKRSLVVDLGTAEGLEIFSRLVATGDVLVQNFRPGAAERMGIGYEAMAAVRPDLVYASISGFGSSGPFSGRRVYDPLIQAASGMAWAQGHGQGAAEGERGAPELVRSIVCDKVTGLTAAQAITAALFARARGAGGQYLELSMLDAAIAFHWSDMMWNHSFLEEDEASAGGQGVATASPPIEPTADLADMFRIYRASDGYIAMIAGSDSEFRGLCNAFGRADMADDPRFETIRDRVQHIEELIAWQTSEIASKTATEVCSLLDEHQVPCSQVNSIPELADDPQVQHNRSIERVLHPVGGAMLQARHPVRYERTPASIRSLAPTKGEHTDEVLNEIGIDSDRIENLREAGVLG